MPARVLSSVEAGDGRRYGTARRYIKITIKGTRVFVTDLQRLHRSACSVKKGINVSLLGTGLATIPWRSVLLRSSASAAASALILEFLWRRSRSALCEILGRWDLPPAYRSLTRSPPLMYAFAILILNGKLEGKEWSLSRNSSSPVKVIIFAPLRLTTG